MNKHIGNLFKGDRVIWMVFFFLCIISAIEVFSASSELTYKGGNYFSPIVKHVGILLFGIAIMLVVTNIPCKYFKIVTPLILIPSVFLLIIVLKFGDSENGAQRWFNLFGIQFQPSEIAKGAVVLATAQILSAMQTDHGADRKAMKYILFVCAATVPFILVENLSTAVLLCGVVFLMMIIGRVPWRQLAKLVAACAAVVTFVILLVLGIGQDEGPSAAAEGAQTEVAQAGAAAPAKKGRTGILHRFDTWKSRIDNFTKSGTEIPPDSVDLNKDAQKAYANIAIASSNFIGKGPGNSVERDFLPQAFSDFIYAIIIEEMGLPGAIFVALLYIVLLFRTGTIANRCQNSFPAFLAMGLALLLVTQALFNMCVAVGIAPITGQPLPLISKGGTSTIINCVYIGAILSVSRTAKKNDRPKTTEKPTAGSTATPQQLQTATAVAS